MELRGRTALVTGGAHRVGQAITLALAEAGADVAINYYSSAEAAQETAAMTRALGVRALPLRADVSRPEEVQAMVAEAEARLGGVDILVNAASLWRKTPFPMADFADWHRVTGILVDGAMYCANAVAPGMLRAGEGAIVNIVDLSAWQPWPGYAAHAVGKAALLALTRQLALELAPGVQVNAVAPGPVLPPPGYSQERAELIAARTLKGRWGSAEDVASAVLFLVRADYITGEVLVVDGGERYGHQQRRWQSPG
jgi:NAD(P)-dependent dehydrogenase (short-subunit alcohol dehydrogenase family)